MGEWYALQRIEKAFEDIKNLLLPFNFSDWLKLAVVVLFTGGAGNFSNFSNSASRIAGQTGSNSATMPGNFMTGMLSHSTIVGSIVAGVLVLLLVMAVVGPIMKFVLLNICRTGKVSVWQRFLDNRYNGLRLLGFKAVVTAVAILFVTVPIGLLVSDISKVAGTLGILAIGIPLIIILSLINLFTDDFVIIQMVEKGQGVLESWEQVLPEIRSQWRQVGIYVLMKIGLSIASGVLAVLATLALVLGLGVIGLVLGAVVFGIYMISQVLGLVVGVVFGTALLLAFIVGTLLIRVPVSCYFRYYSIRIFEDMFDAQIVS